MILITLTTTTKRKTHFQEIAAKQMQDLIDLAKGNAFLTEQLIDDLKCIAEEVGMDLDVYEENNSLFIKAFDEIIYEQLPVH